MPDGLARRFHGLMQPPAAPYTVALAVVPKLLSDTLSRALAELGLVVIPAETLLSEARIADVAVVSASTASWVRARVVVRLPGGADAGVGSVLVGGQRRQVLLDSLPAVLTAVSEHC